MFSCVILRAPNLPGTMTCKFTHFFPPVQQPRKRRSHPGTPTRHRPKTPSIHLPIHPLKKNALFSKRIAFSIYLFPLIGIYT